MSAKSLVILVCLLLQVCTIPNARASETLEVDNGLPNELYFFEDGRLQPLCPFHPACIMLNNRQGRALDLMPRASSRLFYNGMNKKSRFGSNVRLTK